MLFLVQKSRPISILVALVLVNVAVHAGSGGTAEASTTGASGVEQTVFGCTILGGLYGPLGRGHGENCHRHHLISSYALEMTRDNQTAEFPYGHGLVHDTGAAVILPDDPIHDALPTSQDGKPGEEARKDEVEWIGALGFVAALKKAIARDLQVIRVEFLETGRITQEEYDAIVRAYEEARKAVEKELAKRRHVTAVELEHGYSWDTAANHPEVFPTASIIRLEFPRLTEDYTATVSWGVGAVQEITVPAHCPGCQMTHVTTVGYQYESEGNYAFSVTSPATSLLEFILGVC